MYYVTITADHYQVGGFCLGGTKMKCPYRKLTTSYQRKDLIDNEKNVTFYPDAFKSKQSKVICRSDAKALRTDIRDRSRSTIIFV